jgi:hypothetical protein
MANDFFKIKKGLNVEPKTGSTVSASGDVAYNSSTGQLEVYVSGAESISTASNTQTLTNKSIDAGTNTLSNIANASIASGAAIAYSKLNLSGSIVNADVSGSAAIAYSKLNLAGSIVNNDIAGAAGIAYSKLSLSNSIVNADISSSAAIARSKIASGTSNHVIINDGSGNLSSEANLAISRGGTGQGTQTAGFNALSPLTTKGDIIVHNGTNNVRQAIGTDGQVLVGDSSQTNGLKWTTLQQGAKNYITYNNFENNATTGWSLGTVGSLTNGIPTGSPTFGSGSSGNLSISTVSSGQLAGSFSLSYVSSAATTQGDMLASQAYSIDIEDQAKVLTWKFYYKAQSNASNANWSGTSSNSFGVAVYDVTNSTWLGTAGQFSMTQSSGVGYSTGTFQTGATTASIRFIIYNVNATSGAITLYFDDFSVGPQTAPIGPAVSDWVAYTPTFTGFGTVSGVSFQSRRVGDSLEIHGTFTAGTVSATEARITLGYNGGNANVTIDSNKINSPVVIGSAVFANSASTLFGLWPLANGANTYFNFGYQASAAAAINVAQVASFLGNNQSVSVNLIVPISGWSSNVQMSNDTDTRVVAANINNTSTQSITSSATKVSWQTVNFDSHGSFDNVTNYRYTVPVSGTYTFTGNLNFNAAGALLTASVFLYKNGSAIRSNYIAVPSGASFGIPYVFDDQAKAGDYYEIFSSSSTTQTLQSGSQLFIKRLSGPAVVAVTESINMKYTSATATIGTSNTDIPFPTKAYDSHNAYNTSTGIYTVPVSGKYRVTIGVARTSVAGTANNAFEIDLFKNGSLDTVMGTFLYQVGSVSLFAVVNGSAEISCLAGDQLKISGIRDSGAGSAALTGSANFNHLSISRIGN